MDGSVLNKLHAKGKQPMSMNTTMVTILPRSAPLVALQP
jgi:hypothetical protein